jgi:branched-chain amino acid transport system ATP-binding protein
MVFETLRELRDVRGKTLILVEQNARKGLSFSDVGCVLAAGSELLDDPEMGRLFLGGRAT